jgi:beta-lactamase class C
MARTWRAKPYGLITHFLLSMLVVGGSASASAESTAGVGASAPVDPAATALQQTVTDVVASLRTRYNVAGSAIAVTIDGRHRFFDFGVASRTTKQAVNRHTLFEIGSGSKTFAAAVAAHAQAQGVFAWDDPVSQVVPALRGSAFDAIRMWQLGTHSTGLPLNAPDTVADVPQLLAYLKRWTPAEDSDGKRDAATLQRRYSNVGIGLLGWAATHGAQGDYAAIVEHDMLPALDMHDTFLSVPEPRMRDYAQGYTRDDRPIRVHPGVLGDEAYGVKSSAADLIHYLDLQIEATQDGHLHPSSPNRTAPADDGARRAGWLAAFAATQEPWIRAGAITQDLMWEQYAYPVSLAALQQGNGATLTRLPATRLPQTKSGNRAEENGRAIWINKTGSTNGFGSYLVFIPARRIGLVMLFNKNVPIEARVAAAARIIAAIDPDGLRP